MSMHHRHKIISSLIFSILLCGESLYAQKHFGAVSSATGKSGRAAVEGADSLYLNPATIAHLPGSSIAFGTAQSKSEDTGSWDYNLLITDNELDKLFPASIGAYKKKINFDGSSDLEIEDFTLGIARYFGGRLAAGVSYHYYATHLANKNHTQSNFNIGLLFTPTEDLGFGLVAYDVAPPPSSLPDAVKLEQRWGAGATYLANSFLRFRVDASGGSLMGKTHPIWSLGGESFFSKFWVARLGTERDTNTDVLIGCLGVGFIGPRFQLNYAYQSTKEIEGYNSHSIDFVMPF